MDALTLLLLLLGLGSGATTCDADDQGSDDPGRGGKPVGG
jgi:hypothetical protein